MCGKLNGLEKMADVLVLRYLTGAHLKGLRKTKQFVKID
jgi:hypothetical protein